MGQFDFDHSRSDRGTQGSSGLPIPYEIGEVLRVATVANGNEATLAGLTRALWRHRIIITAAALTFMVCTGVYVARQKPVYTSEGAIVVASRIVMIPGIEAVSTPTGDIAIVRSEIGVLGSRTLLQQVAQALHLDADPEFNPLLRPKDDGLLARLDPRPFLHRLLSPGGPARPADQHAYVAAAVEETLQKNLTLLNNENDHVIQLRYMSENPVTSAAVINTLMDRYLAQYAQIKNTAAEEAGSVLSSRADQLRRDADQADIEVANFIKNNGFVETKSGSVNGQQLEELNTQLAVARADRAAAEARYRDALSLSRGGTASNSDVLASPLIQALRTREAELSGKEVELSEKLGPQHPDVQAIQAQLAQLRGTIQSEIGKITTSLKGLADVARARETGLEARLTQLQSAAVSGNTAFNQLQQLKAQADAKRQVYAGFLSKMADAAKPGDRQPIEARIISPAVAPVEPTKARGLFFTLIAGAVGALVAIASCLVYDQLDRGFATLDQVRAVTGLPAYAAIPPTRGRRRRSNLSRYLVDYPHSTLAETLRGVRARLHRTPDNRRVILVTSAQPGEGKTSFALALAQVMAIDGSRTLLIEGDARRPVLGTVLPPSRCAEPAAVLSGEVPWRERIGHDDRTGLFYFVAASPSSSFPGLMDKLGEEGPIGQMKAAFDCVIIDSPPVMRVADAAVLARFVDSIVLVVAAKRTRQRTVAEALRRLFIVSKPIGIVLTNSTEQQDVYTGYGRRARRRWAGFISRSQIG
jgi:succinoglycan biosynthesis transport protein ExoP